jgi:chromosome segregation ATPase
MSKFSTPLLLVLALAAVVGIGGWRSANGKTTAAITGLTTASNKLAEATAKLAEQGATTETLRVQLDLQKTDLVTASNHMAVTSLQLGQQIGRVRELESEMSNRAAQLAAVNRTNAQLQAGIGELQAWTSALQTELEATRARVSEIGRKLETMASALNEAESGKAALLAKLNDPSTLRSQLKSVTAKPKLNSTDPADARLALKPDGSVEVIPQPKAPPTEPAKMIPHFSDPPEEKPAASKFILTY